MRELDDRAHERFAVVVLGDRGNEGLIELQLVDRQLHQVAQRGVTGTEIVEGDLHAQFPKGPQHLRRPREVIVQETFGDLKLEPLWGYPMAVERAPHGRREHSRRQLPLVHVHGELQVAPLRALGPLAEEPAGLVQHPGTELDDEAGLLGERDKDGGR